VTQVEPGLPVGEVGRSDDRPRCPGEDEETSAAVAGGPSQEHTLYRSGRQL
jgi:hypothetical protein